MDDDQRSAKKIKYERPLLVDLMDRSSVVLGACGHGSGPGILQQCVSGGAADSPCGGGGTLQGCKTGAAAIGSCASGNGRY